MGGAAKAGGVLALIGGALVMLEGLLALLGIPIFGSIGEFMNFLLVAVEPLIGIIGGIVLGLLALVGGILMLANKKAGGAIALLVAILWILPSLLILFMGYSTPLFILYFQPTSFFVAMIGIGIWIFTIEGILVLVGGIMGLASGGD